MNMQNIYRRDINIYEINNTVLHCKTIFKGIKII